MSDTMPEWAWIALLTLFAGGAMPLGGLLANIEKIRPLWLERELRHGVIAFGGGALLSGVALVLVPDGVERLSIGWVIVTFAAGGVFFMLLDYYLAKSKTRAGQLVAMLSDFIPEAMILGVTFSREPNMAILIAVLIALQNLPEGFNAFRELRDNGQRPRTLLLAFSALALAGPVAGLAGYHLLQNSMTVVGGIELFAAAGILYLVMYDIAPQAKLNNHWVPGLGAVGGFLLGLVGHMLAV